MASDDYRRRVCAVLLADVSGFSALMGEDEEGTAHAIERLRLLVLEVVTERQGRAQSVAGDAFFASFDSVVAAVDAALEIQRQIARQQFAGRDLRLRIGVHVGDVLFRDDTAVGDAINIAARLESLARPGTVCISEGVYRQVHAKFDDTFTYLGRRRLKNISDPVRAYLIEPRTSAERSGAQRRHRTARLTAGSFVFLVGVAVTYVFWPTGQSAPDRPTEQRELDPGPVAHADEVTVGVMRFRLLGADDTDHGWIREALRDGLNADLSGLQNVKIYSKEFIDFLITRRKLTEVEAATELGIKKMLSGSVMVTERQIRVETHVVDVGTGVLESSYTAEGTQAALLDLQRDVLYGVITGLAIDMTANDRAQLARRDTDVEALRLLLEAEQGTEPAPSVPPASHLLDDRGSGRRRSTRSVRSRLVASAWAAEPDANETEILALVERYRLATESLDLKALGGIYVAFTSAQEAAHARYFENVRDIRVSIDGVDIAVVGSEAVLSFTRTDDFTDARTGRDIHLSVRLTKFLVRDDEGWKISSDE